MRRIFKSKQIPQVFQKNLKHMTFWYDRLMETVGGRLKEGVTICDYGGGHGRLAYHLSLRLHDFKYFLLEPDTKYGNTVLDEAREFIGHDNRVVIGNCDSDTANQAISEADAAVLGSVFTHTSHDETRRILTNLLPIATKNNGIIAFSAFFNDNLRKKVDTEWYYGEDCHSYGAIQTPKSVFEEFAQQHGVTFEHYKDYFHRKKNVHALCRITE